MTHCGRPRSRDCRLARVLVREVMTESVVTAAPARSVQEIAELMRERNVGSVVLVDGGTPGRLHHRPRPRAVGASPTGATRRDRASEHASSPVITAEPDMDVEEAGRADGPPRRAPARRGRRPGRWRASSRSTTSPRAASRSELSRAGYASRAAGLLLPRARRLTTASANARITGCARVPSPASSGWKSVPRKNGWSGELERARRAVLVVGAEDHAGRSSVLDVARARSRRRSGSARRCARRRRSARSACRACSGSGPRGRPASTPARRSRRSRVVAVLGVVRRPRSPRGRGRARGSRAGSRRRCRGTGSRCSRAVRDRPR